MNTKPQSRQVLITGGAGFIGGNLVEYLCGLGGYDITVLDIQNPDLTGTSAEKRIRYIEGDIRDRSVIADAIAGVDCIIHLAADTRVMDSIADPDHNFENNIVGTYRLLRAARDASVGRFVNASSGGAVLGNQTPPVNETMVAAPLAPYGASKLATEGYCSAFSGAYGLSTISLRISNVYGPLSGHKESVVARFLKAILEGRELVVYGDGSQVRDYLFVGDLVKGIRAALESEATGVFQLGTGRPTELKTLIDEIRVVVDNAYAVKASYSSFRQGEIHKTWCDIGKAKKILGFSPNTSLHDGLRQTWDWFLRVYGAG